MKIRNAITVGAITVSVGLLAGCSQAAVTVTSSPLAEPTETQPAVAQTSAAAPANDADSGSDAVAPGDYTPPGSVLAIGDDAIVDYRIATFPDGLAGDPVTSPSGDLVMRVSVTSMTQASVDDLPEDTIITGATKDELGVVKVVYEVQAMGNPAFSMERRDVILDFDPEGYNAFMFFDSQGKIKGCVNPSFLGTEFDAGKTVQGCFLVAYLKASGAPNMTFKPSETDLYTNPLVWKAS